MRLDDFLQYTCSYGRCNCKAVIEFGLPHYLIRYACELHERNMRWQYREGQIRRLDVKEEKEKVSGENWT